MLPTYEAMIRDQWRLPSLFPDKGEIPPIFILPSLLFDVATHLRNTSTSIYLWIRLT